MSRPPASIRLILCVALLTGLPASARPPNYPELAAMIKEGRVDDFRRVLSTASREDINATGRPLLMTLALSSGRPEMVTALLEWGIDPNRTIPLEQNGERTVITPLLYAVSARAGRPVVEALVRHGANPNRSEEGLHPLSFALGLRQYDVASYLLDQGASVEAADSASQITCLMELVVAADDADSTVAALARRLIASGADVNARKGQGVTALRFAIRGSKPQLVRLLLEAGADPNVPNDKGETPLQIASKLKQDEIAALLKSHGAQQ